MDFGTVIAEKPGVRWTVFVVALVIGVFLILTEVNVLAELIPRDSRYYLDLGNSSLQQEMYEQAIQDFGEAILLNPQHHEAYYYRGSAYHSLGQYEQAIQDFGEAIRLDSQYSLAYGGRGLAYLSLGQYEHAAQEFDELIRLDPGNGFNHYNRAVARDALGRHQEALDDFGEAFRLEGPIPKPAYANLDILSNASFSFVCMQIPAYLQLRDIQLNGYGCEDRYTTSHLLEPTHTPAPTLTPVPVLEPTHTPAPTLTPVPVPTPTHTPPPTLTPVPTPTPTNTPRPLPNLSSHVPGGWDMALVASSEPGTNVSDTLHEEDGTYFDWAIRNNSAIPIQGSFKVNLLLDGAILKSWKLGGLNTGQVSTRQDFYLKLGKSGSHVISLVIDADQEIAESNENDNTIERSVFWVPLPEPTATIGPTSTPAPNSLLGEFEILAVADGRSDTFLVDNPPISTLLSVFDLQTGSGYIGLVSLNYEAIKLHTARAQDYATLGYFEDISTRVDVIVSQQGTNPPSMSGPVTAIKLIVTDVEDGEDTRVGIRISGTSVNPGTLATSAGAFETLYFNITDGAAESYQITSTYWLGDVEISPAMPESGEYHLEIVETRVMGIRYTFN